VKVDGASFEKKGRDIVNTADLESQLIENIIRQMVEVAQRTEKLDGSLTELEACLNRLNDLNKEYTNQLKETNDAVGQIARKIDLLPPPVGIDSTWIQEQCNGTKVSVSVSFLVILGSRVVQQSSTVVCPPPSYAVLPLSAPSRV